jgi:hypothetical protein
VSNGGSLTLSFNDPGSPATATVARGTSAIAGSGSWQGNLVVTSEDLEGMSVVIDLARQ